MSFVDFTAYKIEIESNINNPDATTLILIEKRTVRLIDVYHQKIEIQKLLNHFL